jgi:hypothetical protein
MTTINRAAASTGAIGIVALLIALFLPGPPPKTTDTINHLTNVLIHKRHLLLAGTYLAGLGALAFMWFLGTLAQFLHNHTRQLAPIAAAVIGGLTGVIAMLTGIALVSGATLRAASLPGAGPTTRALIDSGNVLIEMSKFGLALLVLATTNALWRSDVLTKTALRVGVAAGTLPVLSALSPFIADRGLWQFGGPPEILGAAPAAVWIIYLSLTLVRYDGSQPVPQSTTDTLVPTKQ